MFKHLIVSVICGLILFFLTTYVINILTGPHGAIEIETIELKDGNEIAIVRIVNFSEKSSFDNLKIVVPKVVDKSLISSSPHLVIEENEENTFTNKSGKILSFSEIPSNAISTIIIPIEKNSPCCTPLNLEKFKIVNYSGWEPKNNHRRIAIYDAFVASITFTLIFLLFLLYEKNMLSNNRNKLVSEIDENVQLLNKNIEANKKLVKQLEEFKEK